MPPSLITSTLIHWIELMAIPTHKGGREMYSSSVTGGTGMSVVKSYPVYFIGPSILTSCSKQGNSGQVTIRCLCERLAVSLGINNQ